MDSPVESSPGGTTPEMPEQVVGGTRRRVYQQDEHLAMINRDTFDTLESIITDRGIFSHLAVGCLTFALTLGAEKGIDHYEGPTDATFYQLWLCGIVGLVGLVFLGFAINKWRRYRTQRSGLFSEERLLSDNVIVYTADGTRHHTLPTS